MSTLQALFISLLIVVTANDGMEVSRRAFAKWKAPRGLGRNSVLNAPPMCAKAIDLGLVMDRSVRDAEDWPHESFDDPDKIPHWNNFKEFAKELVSNFDISDDMTHIGAISFDQTAEVLLKFNDLLERGNSLEEVYKQMKTWQSGSPDAETKIDQALQLALKGLFKHRYGARGYDQVLVLLTYGRQSSVEASKVARDLEKNNVKVLVVGFGLPDPTELWNIAGNPENVFYVSDLDKVDSVADQVAQAVCQG